MKLENGDLFEHTKRDWLRAKLPSYETVWSEFIGHDSKGHPLLFPGLSPEQEHARKMFYQAHYSLAVTSFQLDSLCDRIDAMQGSHNNVSDYLREIEDFTLFVSYVGHIHDMAEDIAQALRDTPILTPFRPFFALRSHALHAARVPLQRDDVGLKIPKISWSEKQPGEWHDQKPWEDTDPSKFIYLTDFCRGVRDDLFTVINEVHPLIRNKAHLRFPGIIGQVESTSFTFYQSGSNYTYFPPASGSANI